MLQTFLPTFLKIKCDTFFFTIQMKKAKSCFVFSEHSVCVLSADTDEHTVECIQKVQRKGSGGAGHIHQNNNVVPNTETITPP